MCSFPTGVGQRVDHEAAALGLGRDEPRHAVQSAGKRPPAGRRSSMPCSRPQAAQLGHDRMAALPISSSTRPQLLARGGRRVQQPLLLDHVDHLAADGAPERVAREGVAVGEAARRRHTTSRICRVATMPESGTMPAADALAEGDHVGHGAEVLDPEPAAGAAEAGDDLVGDQQHLVAVAHLADRGQIAVGQRHRGPRRAGHRLDARTPPRAPRRATGSPPRAPPRPPRPWRSSARPRTCAAAARTAPASASPRARAPPSSSRGSDVTRLRNSILPDLPWSSQ